VQNPVSKTVIILLIAIIVLLNFLYPSVKILTWDVFGYYLYLPLTFIYHDLRLENLDVVMNIYDRYEISTTLYQVFKSPEGSWVIKYSMGWSLLNMPFFFIGHIIALHSEFPADGFSLPYHKAIWAGGMCYTIMALILLRKILVRFFSDRLSALVLIILVLGTNYLYTASFIAQNTMPQNFGFTLYVFILWFTIRWHNTHRIRDTIWLAVFCGLNILSRPTEVVCLLIPIFWGVYGKDSLKSKLKFFWGEKRNHVLVFALILLGIGSLQFAYWKMTSGSLMYYSYGNTGGEGLDLHNPHILKVLFSFRKGWLIYTPVMLSSIFGMWSLYRRNRPLFYPVLIYFLVNLYIVSSWSTWWYAASYGQRALIPSYVLLALPLGYGLMDIKTFRWIWKAQVIFLVSFLIGLNLFQTWQYSEGIIDRSRMTRAYYFRIFGKTRIIEEDQKLLLVSRWEWPVEHVPDEKDYLKSRLYFNPYVDTSRQVTDSASYYRLNPERVYTPAYRVKYRDLTKKDHVYLRASAEVFVPEQHRGLPAVIVMCCEHKGKIYKYNTMELDPEKIRYNDWNRISMDYLSPQVRSKKDKLVVYLWYRGEHYNLVRNLEILLFEPIYKRK
jgi:hypothetical protein